MQPADDTPRKHHGDEARGQPVIGYGQYDPRLPTTSFLAALRTMPAPWRVGAVSRKKQQDTDSVKVTGGSHDAKSETASNTSGKEGSIKTIVDM